MHFGVDYYPEHWPESRWETDAALMRDMRIEVVRLAEFAWQKLEPALGRFDFAWSKIFCNVAHGFLVFVRMI